MTDFAKSIIIWPIVLIFVVLYMTGCGVDVSDSTHTIVVQNPIIDYCERKFSKLVYPDEYERELYIIECLDICSTSDKCSTQLPDGYGNI